jgi:hypothetical protein
MRHHTIPRHCRCRVADLYEQIRKAGGQLPGAPRRTGQAASDFSTTPRRRRRRHRPVVLSVKQHVEALLHAGHIPSVRDFRLPSKLFAASCWRMPLHIWRGLMVQQ